MSEHEHHHAHGRDCCPHPDCERSERRRVAKAQAKFLAQKIKTKVHDSADVQALADTVLVILDE